MTDENKNRGGRSLRKMKTHDSKISYEIVGERISQGRVYRLVKCSFPDVNARARKRILEKYLDTNGAIGLIEWWTRGSIARRPWRMFYVILVLDVAHAK